MRQHPGSRVRCSSGSWLRSIACPRVGSCPVTSSDSWAPPRTDCESAIGACRNRELWAVARSVPFVRSSESAQMCSRAASAFTVRRASSGSRQPQSAERWTSVGRRMARSRNRTWDTTIFSCRGEHLVGRRFAGLFLVGRIGEVVSDCRGFNGILVLARATRNQFGRRPVPIQSRPVLDKS